MTKRNPGAAALPDLTTSFATTLFSATYNAFSMMRLPLFALLALTSALFAQAPTNSYPTWEAGQPAPAFSGYDEKGLFHSLDEFKGKWVIFDISTSWCLPSFELAESIRLVKNALAAQDIPLISFTLVDEGPLHETYAGRGQALAWEQAFPESDVVVAHHIGFSDGLDPMNELRNLIGSTFNRKGFPIFVVIEPSGIIRYVSTLGSSDRPADEILALILPGQPPITEARRDVNLGFYQEQISPEVTVRIGKKWGRSRHPRVNIFPGGYSIPALEQGSLSKIYGIGFGVEASPKQQIVKLFYDTRLPMDWSEPGIPEDQDITFRLHIPRWKTLRPVLTAATAKVTILDYIDGHPLPRDVPVTVQGNDLLVGPFHADATGSPARAIDVSFNVSTPNPNLLAVQSADLCLAFPPLNTSGPLLYSQWLAVENAANLPRTVAACDLLLERVRSLRRTVSRVPAADLGRAQRLAFLRSADEIRLFTLQEKAALRKSARRAGEQ
jgi:hypothetical protein